LASRRSQAWVRRYFYVQEDTDEKVRLLAQALGKSEPEVLAAAINRVWTELREVNPLVGYFPQDEFHLSGAGVERPYSNGAGLPERRFDLDQVPIFGPSRPVSEVRKATDVPCKSGASDRVGGAS
jgi:hypothetical protein